MKVAYPPGVLAGRRRPLVAAADQQGGQDDQAAEDRHSDRRGELSGKSTRAVQRCLDHGHTRSFRPKGHVESPELVHCRGPRAPRSAAAKFAEVLSG
ncbi:hypothetical protein Sru01_26040 [Sphaerisporangium rufum]|uniref:Uncharacterized protein n=1 Tax=Sphaerisporangium rufum TaxID=1381558 RepID=A0A919V0M9_9ACTN|nr:hypothetical protein Sru01_26040 [Sphaerisporangium rufum]